MKYKLLKIKNIASIEEAEIDFAEENFAKEPIFLISGKTGSGKSTILDAVCLALYGRTPRTESGNSAKYKDEFLKGSSDISYSDVRQYLKRGAKEGGVEFTFEGNDGTDYMASVAFRMTRNKTIANAEYCMTNLATGEETKGVTAVTAMSEKLIGLDFMQFCRTSMLAQGKFTEFLKSKENEKSEILQKITGTRIYSEMGKKIHEKLSEKTKTYDRENEKLGDIELLTEEKKEELERERIEKEATVKEKEAAVKELMTEKNWYGDEKKLRGEMERTEAEKVEIEKEMSGEEFRGYVQCVADWKRTKRAREAMTALDGLVKRNEANEKERKRLEEVLKNIGRRRAWQKGEIERCGAKVADIDTYMESEKGNRKMYEESDTIVNLLNQAKASADAAEAQRAAAKELRDELPEIEKKCEAAQSAVTDKEQKEMGALTQRIAEETAKRDAYDLNALNSRSERLNNYIIELTNAVSALKELDKEEKVAEEKQRELEKEREALKGLKAAEEKAAEAAEMAEKAEKHAKEQLEKVKESVSDFAKSLRANLKVGDTCPVCGKKVTELVNDEDMAMMLAPMKEDVEKSEAAKRTADSAWEKAKVEEKASENRCGDLEKDMNRSRDKAEKLRGGEVCRRALSGDILEAGDVIFPETSNEKKIEIYEKEKEEKKVELNGLGKKQKEALDVQKVLDDLQKENGKLTTEIENLRGEMRRLEDKKKTIASKIETAEKIVDVKSRDEQSAMKELEERVTYADWKVIGYENLSKRLKEESERYNNRMKEKEALTTEMETMRREMAEYDKAVAEAYVSGLDLDSNNSNNSNDSDTLDAVPAEADCDAFVKDMTLLKREKENNEKERTEKEQTLEDELRKTQMTRERVRELADIKEEEEADTEKRVTTKEGELKSATGAAEQARKQWEKHRQSAPERSEEDVDTELATEQKAMNESNMRIGELKRQIEDDIKKKSEHAEQLKRVEQARAEMAEWGRLQQIFGDATGAKFRNIAQSYVLRELLYHANDYLRKLTERYELICQPKSLVIMLKDNYILGQTRPVEFVSGGESFIVSLALALGLSSLNRNNVTTDILFIDEGFGTLDSVKLDTVMSTLGTLHELGGNRVGIISHVEYLKERINAHIEVTKRNNTTSDVKMVVK